MHILNSTVSMHLRSILYVLRIVISKPITKYGVYSAQFPEPAKADEIVSYGDGRRLLYSHWHADNIAIGREETAGFGGIYCTMYLQYLDTRADF